MPNFTTVKLADIAEIITGSTPSASQPDSWGNEVEFITPSDQSDSYREANPSRFLSADGAARLRKRLIPARSTNLTCIGSTIGKVSMAMSEAVTNQQINSIVAKSDIANPDFIYYMIKNWSTDLKQYASGSATPIINKSDLSNYEFSVPPLTIQKSIGEVLGALDDKIAANTKLATTAIRLATTLFKQALQSATYSDESFADVAKVSGGGTPKTKTPEYWDGNIPWATPTDVTALTGPYLGTTSRTISEAGLAACASDLYPAGSILMTSRATIGAFAFTQVPTAVNQGFIVVQPNDPSTRYWIFHEMYSRVDEFVSLANGATFLELSRGNFKKFKIRMASPEIIHAFNETAKTLHGTARAALSENSALAMTRDTLLPHLMSGKLKVKQAEEIVASAI